MHLEVRKQGGHISKTLKAKVAGDCIAGLGSSPPQMAMASHPEDNLLPALPVPWLAAPMGHVWIVDIDCKAFIV